jgi:tetratricopeptide (TPR) repeat protein
MSDPLSTTPVRGADAPGDADREARIEQLLLLGLDHYFAGHYEHAISVWTRVVFLERHHDRARAYIERARSALAERHRETEELLHVGVSAYNAGEVDKARELLTRAGDQGSDTAHFFLDRLNRVAVAAPPADLRIDPLPPRPAPARPRVTSPPQRRGWTTAAIFALVLAVGMLVGGLPIGSWLSELQVAAPAPPAQAALDEPLPVVRASEMAVARAHELYAGGRLRDALRQLDRVDIADPLRAEADRLRIDIQRQLLAAAGIPTPGPVGVQP